MSILIVLAAAIFGSLAGFLAAKRIGYGSKWVIAGALILAAIAAVATNATQFLLDLGLPFTAVDVLEAGSYFVFGFSCTSAWVLLKPSSVRWLLLLLVPIALFEPLRWAVAIIKWGQSRFM